MKITILIALVSITLMPAYLLAKQKEDKKDKKQHAIRAEYYIGLFERNPTLAVSKITKMPDDDRAKIIPHIAQGFFREDPEGAHEIIAQIPDEELRELFIKFGVKKIKNPKGSDTSTNSKDAPERVDYYIQQFKRNPNMVISKIAKMDDAERALYVPHIAQNIFIEDPEKILSIINHLPDETLRATFMELGINKAMISAFVRDDPDGARAFIALLPDEKREFSEKIYINDYFPRLIQEDPSAFISEISSIPESDREYFILNMASSLFGKNPNEILDVIMKIEDESLRLAIIEHGVSKNMVTKLAKNDPAALKSFIDRLPKTKQEFSQYLYNDEHFTDLILEDPDAAIEEITGLPDERRAELIFSLADSLFQGDLNHAQNVINLVADQDSRNSIIEQAINGAITSHHKSTEIYDWITGMTADTPSRNVIVLAVMNQVAKDRPKTAFKWATEIAQTKLRVGSLKTIISRWGRFDPDAARAALMSNNDLSGIEFQFYMGLIKSKPE